MIKEGADQSNPWHLTGITPTSPEVYTRLSPMPAWEAALSLQGARERGENIPHVQMTGINYGETLCGSSPHYPSCVLSTFFHPLLTCSFTILWFSQVIFLPPLPMSGFPQPPFPMSTLANLIQSSHHLSSLPSYTFTGSQSEGQLSNIRPMFCLIVKTFPPRYFTSFFSPTVSPWLRKNWCFFPRDVSHCLCPELVKITCGVDRALLFFSHTNYFFERNKDFLFTYYLSTENMEVLDKNWNIKIVIAYYWTL